MLHIFQELFGPNKKNNYKKFGLIGLGVIVLIAVITVIVVFATRSNDDNTPTGEALTFENYNVYPNKNNGTWISGNELMFRDIEVS